MYCSLCAQAAVSHVSTVVSTGATVRHTRCKLVGGDVERLDMQAERIEREVRRHSQDLLGVAHVGVAEGALQVVEIGVTGQQRSCGETSFVTVSQTVKDRREKLSVTGLNVPLISAQVAESDTALRWNLLVEEFCVSKGSMKAVQTNVHVKRKNVTTLRGGIKSPE